MSKPTLPPNASTLSQRSDKVRLDWRAYFEQFCLTNGEPVHYKNRLLFRNGWQYSSTEYEGPEYLPPANTEELDALVLEYWKIRQSSLSALVAKLIHERDTLKKLQQSRSVPLQQATIAEDEQGHKRRSYKPVSLELLNMRIQWVQVDLEECDTRLKEIVDYNNKKGNTR